MSGLIESWAAGKALNLGVNGAKRLADALVKEHDSLGRLLVLLHAEFAEECDLQRDVFYAWRKHEQLVAVLDDALAGRLLGAPQDVDLVAAAVQPRLLRTPPPAQRPLAERIAHGVFAAVPLAVDGGDEATRLLREHIDGLRKLLDERVPAQAVRHLGVGEPIFYVPVRTPAFVGRGEQLRQLGEALDGEGAVAITQVHAIHGMGGVGKTQLAARYAREHRDDYDVIWWLRAEQPATLRTDLADLAAQLGLREASGDDEQQAVDATLLWLERSARWLVIFDNAPDPEAIAGLLVEGRGGHVLITSRTHADWGSVGASSVALDVWPRNEANRFLVDRTTEQDPQILDGVAEALGDLPLALEQAAAYANTQAITLSTYLQRLRDRAPELFAAGRPVDYEHTVATVWQLAFEQIASQPVAQQLLEVCSFMGAERIPRELLETLADHSSIAAVSGGDVDDAIAVLLGYALLTPAVEFQDTLGMHRLIAQLTRQRADTDTQASAASMAVKMLAGLWPERPWEHEHWPACQRLLAHALTATEHTQQLNAAAQRTAILLTRIGQYQEARAEYTPARELLERALAIEEAVYGSEHPEVAITLGNLGIVQQELGEFEAARVTLKRALAIKEAVYGPEHPEVAITLTNLGNVQQQLGEFEAARATLTRALAIFEQFLGPRHPNTVQAREILSGMEAPGD